MIGLPQNVQVLFATIAGCLLAAGVGYSLSNKPREVTKLNNNGSSKKTDQRQSYSNTITTAPAVVLPTLKGPKPHYLAAQWDKIHFKPAIDEATNSQCLVCHHEIVTHKVRKKSPAGLKTSQALAWYQTLDTYKGDQVTFHDRHLTSPFAKKVMNLKCNFCHQGHDPREEAGFSSATSKELGDFTLRKTVNPEKSCLMCHGRFPAASMGLEGSWADLREGFEDEETQNGCLMCHQETFRTVRHQVNYLNAKAIEDLATKGTSDVCIGCHGGRAWYRTSYPYPRHAWPDMPEETPEWAKARPTESAPEHRLVAK